MRMLRKLGGGIGSVVFSLALGILILNMGMEEFTNYNTLKPIFVSIAAPQFEKNFEGEKINQIYTYLTTQCSNKESVEMDLGGNQKLVLSCAEVNATKKEDLKELFSRKIFDSIYYKEYSCDFIKCLQNSDQKTFYNLIISKKANEFFKQLTIYLVSGVVVGLILIIVSMETWSSRLKTIGFTCISIGIFFIVIPFIKDFALQQASVDVSGVGDILDVVMNIFYEKMLIIFVAGVILVIVGFLIGRIRKN
jgi:hypothetical protein